MTSYVPAKFLIKILHIPIRDQGSIMGMRTIMPTHLEVAHAACISGSRSLLSRNLPQRMSSVVNWKNWTVSLHLVLSRTTDTKQTCSRNLAAHIWDSRETKSPGLLWLRLVRSEAPRSSWVRYTQPSSRGSMEGGSKKHLLLAPGVVSFSPCGRESFPPRPDWIC